MKIEFILQQLPDITFKKIIIIKSQIEIALLRTPFLKCQKVIFNYKRLQIKILNRQIDLAKQGTDSDKAIVEKFFMAKDMTTKEKLEILLENTKLTISF